MSHQPNSSQRIEVVDSLRGIASLSVAWFHLTLGADGWLKSSGAYGWLGVDVFFVISGFVIPLALHRASYQLSQYGRFVIKRLLRLDPPYLASIGLIVLLSFLSPYLPGAAAKEPFSLSPAQLLLHLGYANVFFGYPWYNMVFWSLAIEFQYYLTVGLVFPILRGSRLAPKLILGGALCLGAFLLPSEAFIFHYGFLFLLGISVYRYHVAVLTRLSLFGMLALCTAGNCLTVGKAAAIAGLLTAAVIAFVRVRIRALVMLGAISYSLYLLHVPVGYRALNLFTRWMGPGLAATLISLGVSIVAAVAFYWAVEKPSQRLAALVRLKGKRAEALLDQPAL